MHALILAGLCALGVAQQETPRLSPEPIFGKSITARRMAIVSTTAPEAIRAGHEILERGGSAVDAALTTALLQTTLCGWLLGEFRRAHDGRRLRR